MQQGGVAIMMSATAKGPFMKWTPDSKIIITARYNTKYKKLTVVLAYALTNDAMDEEKNKF